MNTIQASELRIGNFIGMNLEEYPNNFFTALEIGETMKVYEGLITLKGATIKRVETSFMYVDDFEPIPLNEDWLVRFSFEKAGIRFSKDWFYLWEQDDKIIFALAEMKEITGTYLEIKYVHTLQNLYFALAGTELTLTDK